MSVSKVIVHSKLGTLKNNLAPTALLFHCKYSLLDTFLRLRAHSRGEPVLSFPSCIFGWLVGPDRSIPSINAGLLQ